MTIFNGFLRESFAPSLMESGGDRYCILCQDYVPSSRRNDVLIFSDWMELTFTDHFPQSSNQFGEPALCEENRNVVHHGCYKRVQQLLWRKKSWMEGGISWLHHWAACASSLWPMPLKTRYERNEWIASRAFADMLLPERIAGNSSTSSLLRHTTALPFELRAQIERLSYPCKLTTFCVLHKTGIDIARSYSPRRSSPIAWEASERKSSLGRTIFSIDILAISRNMRRKDALLTRILLSPTMMWRVHR